MVRAEPRDGRNCQEKSADDQGADREWAGGSPGFDCWRFFVRLPGCGWSRLFVRFPRFRWARLFARRELRWTLVGPYRGRFPIISDGLSPWLQTRDRRRGDYQDRLWRIHRISSSRTKVLEVLSTRGYERMIRFENARRDRAGPSKAGLGIVRLFGNLAHDSQVVQRVGEIRMEWPEAGLLQKGSLAEK